MEPKDTQKTVSDIDAQVRKNPWMDFEVTNYDRQMLSVIGNISPSYPGQPGQIEINFKDVYFVSLPIAWKTDTSKQVISLVDGPEQFAINKLFRVEQGYLIFKFMPEDYQEGFGCLIGAKEISYRVL